MLRFLGWWMLYNSVSDFDFYFVFYVQGLTHYMGLYFAKSRGGHVVNKVTFSESAQWFGVCIYCLEYCGIKSETWFEYNVFEYVQSQ